MSLEEYSSSPTKKRLIAGILGGTGMGAGVAIDRILEDAELGIILLSASKQGLSTLIMATGCLYAYDLLVKSLDRETSDILKKGLIGAGLASLSSILNYAVQKNTLGSTHESLIVGGIAFGGLIVHEFDLIDKTK